MSGIQQHLQSSTVEYSVQSLTVPYSAPSDKQLSVNAVTAYNGTAADNGVGIFHSVAKPHFKIWRLLAAGDAEVTTALQAGTATSIFNTTNNDGCLFQAKEKFNMVAVNISQASTGSPVYTYKYWNGAWTNLTLLNTPDFSTTGVQVLLFNAPTDWVVGDGTETTDDTLYSIQIISTTAPSQAVQVNSVAVCKMLAYADYVQPGGSVYANFDTSPYLLQVGESIIPFFSYANSSNRIDMTYKINP